MRRPVAAALAALAGLLLPGAAAAATVEVVGGSQAVRYTAGPGERNDLRVAELAGSWPSAFIVHDPGAAIAAGPGCVSIDPHGAVCTANSGAMYRARIALGDEADVLAPTGFTLVRADGGPGDDQLAGGTWDDHLTGGSGTDRLAGGEGADELVDGAGAEPDTFDGGPGEHDTISYAGRATAVAVDLADGRPDGGPGEGDTLSGVEHVTGGGGDDALAGDGRANRIIAGGGADRIVARGGDDEIRGARAGRVDCGAGSDDVHGVRAAVILARSCERVLKPVQDDHFHADAHPRPRGGDRLTLDMACPEDQGEPMPCRGTVTLAEADRPARVLARGGIDDRDGTRATAHLRLTSAGRRTLARRDVVATVRLRGRVALAWSIVLRRTS